MRLCKRPRIMKYMGPRVCMVRVHRHEWELGKGMTGLVMDGAMSRPRCMMRTHHMRDMVMRIHLWAGLGEEFSSRKQGMIMRDVARMHFCKKGAFRIC